MALAGVATDARAQFTQYVSPGSLALAPVPTMERLETAVEEASYHLGPIAWSPWFAIKDVNYITGDDVVTPGSDYDLTATAALGVHAYLQPRQTLYFAAHAIPEYAWWKNNENRTVTNWSYGLGMFAFFSKLTLEAVVINSRHQEYLSSAVQELVNTGKDEARAGVEVPLFGKISVYGSASTIEWRYREDDFVGEAGKLLLTLDRDEDRVGGGLRWRIREGFSVGAGYEEVDVQFIRPERDRSNTGTAPVLDAQWDGGKVSLGGRVSWVSLEPKPGSSFVPFEDTLGSVQLRYSPARRTSIVVYGGRTIAFSYIDPSPYFVDQRTGISLERQFGWRSGGQVYYETGIQDFVARGEGVPARSEDMTTLGASLTMQVHRSLTMMLGASKTEYDALSAAADRSVTRFQVSLRSGDQRSQWW